VQERTVVLVEDKMKMVMGISERIVLRGQCRSARALPSSHTFASPRD
jgi:hypothetical protein